MMGAHVQQADAAHDLACMDCRRPLKPNPRRKSQRCQPCAAREIHTRPGVREAKSRSQLAHWSNPDNLARRTARLREGIAAARARPEFRASKIEQGRRVGLLGLGMHALPAGHPVMVAMGKAVSETRLSWCPPVYRDEYRRLRRKMRTAEAAKAAILEMIRKQARDMERGLLPQDDFMKVRAALRWIAQKGGCDA